MDVNWQLILQRLQNYPPNVQRLLPPCAGEQLDAVQSELGKMPNALVDMLGRFNGARLFVKSGPLVSIFGISTIPPLPSLEWAPDWYIDKFTRAWRSSGRDRQNDWAIAMMNYGGLIILSEDGSIREWDTSQRIWNTRTFEFDEWVAEIFREGDAYMKDIP